MTVAKKLAWLILMLSLVCIGVRMAVAGVAAYQAEAFMAVWKSDLREPAPQAWQVANNAAHRAIAWYPVPMGGYQDRLGRVYSWQMFQHPPGDIAATSSRREALAAYRQAVQLRPDWPDTQARLAHAKLLLLELDSEFELALARADELGRYRLPVNEEVALVSLAAWSHLNAVQRQRGERHALQLLDYGRDGEKTLRAIGARYHLPAAVCVALVSRPGFSKACS